MPKAKRYFIAGALFSHGYRDWTVTDRITGKVVFRSLFEGRARAHCLKLNKSEASYPGGFNKGTNS